MQIELLTTNNSVVRGKINILTMDDLSAVVTLQEYAKKTHYYQPCSNEILINCLSNNLSISVWIKNKLQAILLIYNGTTQIAAGTKIYTDCKKDNVPLLCLAGVVVLPIIQGNRLQYRLSMLSFSRAREANYEHIFSVVHPNNTISMANMFLCGGVIKDYNHKCMGKPRFVYLFSLNSSTISYNYSKLVNRSDFKKQKRLLEQGYVGRLFIKQQIVYSIG